MLDIDVMEKTSTTRVQVAAKLGMEIMWVPLLEGNKMKFDDLKGESVWKKALFSLTSTLPPQELVRSSTIVPVKDS